MSEVPHYVLYEHAVGYVLMKIKEFEDAGLIIDEVDASIADVSKFSSVVKLAAFDPFKNTEAALENANAISEGLAHTDLINFLESSLPKKKKKIILGVNDPRLASSLSEADLDLKLVFGGVVTEILRGIRVHFAHLAKNLPHHSLSKAQLSLGHSYSRGKVKFDVHRVDNMVIQSIALLDQLDKDINLFGMRIREWYSYHFPELFKLVPDQYKYVRLAVAILDRNKMSDNECLLAEIEEILDGDSEKALEVFETARTSMGMDISELDLVNIERFATRVASLTEYRQRLHEYIKDRMNNCAPSLSALIGEQVGARLISHAGSLTNLAKYPASTVQILGAEKALFRALKTRYKKVDITAATPKYGLLFHSSFIGRASTKNKGRISRFLANKCTIASRIDCFSEVPVSTFGEYLRGQVEERLKYFETGEIPQKNLEVMAKAQEEAQSVQQKVLKKRKKAAKKARKIREETACDAQAAEKTEKRPLDIAEDDDLTYTKPKKKKKKEQNLEEEEK
ncbi:snoRNA binding domain protein [Dictyocaulus viviparus]|uniref:Nucleolar protein 56 n=1 Tax=Dictyocaulus viviparus TaxID=29172 RepID=A0A0D8XDZ8_DICVI|nr:snoRNA binding domain protein [Dictyocaulus viviparus]